MTDQKPSPGWYPDPAGGDGTRWWDGGRWTEHVRTASESVDALADLPPPSPGQRFHVAGPEYGERATGAGRPRRSLLAWLGAGLLIVVGIGVGAAILGGQPAHVAGDRLVDLPEQPSVAWTLDTRPLFDEVIDEIDRYARENEWWGPTGQEIRAGGAEYLVDHGWVTTWDVSSGRAVVSASLLDFTGRLHGLDTDRGEIVWSSEPLVAPQTGWSQHVPCQLDEPGHMFCMLSGYDDARDLTQAVLRIISLDDGRTVDEVDVTRRDADPRLVRSPEGGVIVLSVAAARTIVTRYDIDGSVVWESDLEGALSVSTSVVQDLLLVRDNSIDGEWHEVLDARTGEPELRVPPAIAGPGRHTRYRDWAGELVRIEEAEAAGSLRTTVSIIDQDGQERWWVTGQAGVIATRIIEPGAPILVVDPDTHRVSALDPSDGETLWVQRLRGVDRPTAILAGAREVVLMGEEEIAVLAASSGELQWSRRHRLGRFGRPVSIASSMIYLVEDGARLRALDLADGEQRWSWSAPPGRGSARLAELGGRLSVVRTDVIHGLE